MSGDAATMMIMLGLFFSLAFVIKVVSDNWTKKKALEQGVSREVVRTVFRLDRDPLVLSSLKWGMVAVGLGIALILADMWDVSFEQPGTYGTLLLFGGVALILYYRIVRKVLGSGSRADGTHDEPGSTGGAGVDDRLGG